MQIIRLLVCLVAIVVPARRGIAGEKEDVARAVHVIFEAKCADCHGAHLPKPKGRFGYVLDLERVGKNAEFVKPGDFAGSELYEMLRLNEMPGEDADVPPLTPDELKTVARWIALGAPAAPPPAPQVAPKPAVPGKNSASFFKRGLSWLGNFHPASTHFPIALLSSAVLAEALAWFTRREAWLLVTRFLVVLGGLTAPGVATLGWLNAKVSTPLVEWHRWLGTGTAAWAVVCAVLVCASECSEGSPERRRFRGALLLGALLVTVTGMLGGFLTFGTEHYSW